VIAKDDVRFVFFCKMPGLFQVGLELPFSRFLESEADEVGILLAAKACYDVRYFPLFWRRQSELVPEQMSTHPSHSHRAADIEKHLPKVTELVFKAKLQPDNKTI
jgi:predicted Zn-dependent protease